MKCEDVQKKLPAYEAGTLGGGEQAEILLHVRSCPVCGAEEKVLAVLWRALDAMPSLDASPGFKARFWEKAREQESQRRGGWARWTAWAPLAAGAMAAWLLGVAGGIGLSGVRLPDVASGSTLALKIFTATQPLNSIEAAYLSGPSGRFL